MENHQKKIEQGFISRGLHRIGRWFSIRNLTWMGIIGFVLLLLPICYLSFVNRASGDDYGYSVYTRTAWMATHSFTELVKASMKMIKQCYYGWQGTWFSMFLFTMQPEVFSDGAYVITAFLMLFLWIGSTFLLFKQILMKDRKMDKWSVLLITLLFLIISIQFIPGIKSAIFWFNGGMHYMLPFAMCQVLWVLLIKYGETYQKRYFAGIVILMTLLGGSNYQAALFAMIIAVYTGLEFWVEKKNKKILLLLVPLLLEACGLVVSMLAPGNKVRGGEDFGFSVADAFGTIALSFVYGLKDIIGYVKEKPLAFAGLGILFLIALEAFKRRKAADTIHYPIIKCLALFCLYSAMQAPAIYAGVEVSRGVLNTNYQMFLLTAGGMLLILAERMAVRMKLSEESVHTYLVIPGLVISLMLVIVFRGDIRTSTTGVCLEYITSGQAGDFKEQMDLQTRLLEEEGVTDVVVPFINDVQGPLMHMPVTDNPEAWTNMVTKDFYGKDSVVAIPRDEWNEKYGK